MAGLLRLGSPIVGRSVGIFWRAAGWWMRSGPCPSGHPRTSRTCLAPAPPLRRFLTERARLRIPPSIRTPRMYLVWTSCQKPSRTGSSLRQSGVHPWIVCSRGCPGLRRLHHEGNQLNQRSTMQTYVPIEGNGVAGCECQNYLQRVHRCGRPSTAVQSGQGLGFSSHNLSCKLEL